MLGTGLILSFEPWLVVRAIEPGSLTPAKIQTLLSQHDPSGQARALVYRSYDKTLTISAGRGGGTVVDVATGAGAARTVGRWRTLSSRRGACTRHC